MGVQTGDLVQRCTSDVETVRRFVQMQAMEGGAHRGDGLTAISIMLPISWRDDGRIHLPAAHSCGVQLLLFPRRAAAVHIARMKPRARFPPRCRKTRRACAWCAFAQESSELDKFTRRNKAYHDITLHLTTLMGAYWGLSRHDRLSSNRAFPACAASISPCTAGSAGNVPLFTTYTSMLTFPHAPAGPFCRLDLRQGGYFPVPFGGHPCRARRSGAGQRPLPRRRSTAASLSRTCASITATACPFPMFRSPYGPARPLASSAARARAKSSLVQLLQRLYPVTAGRITLSGVDVNDIERHHLRRNVGIVLQEPFLYSRTIGETSPSPGRTRIFRTYMPPRTAPRY